LEDIAKKYNATPGQVALAWILAQGEDIVVIPGTKKIKVKVVSLLKVMGYTDLSCYSVP